MLTQAGYPNGFEIVETIFPRFDVPENTSVMEAVGDYMKDIGITVNFETKTASGRLSIQRERAMQGQIGPFVGGYRDVQFTARAYYAEPGAGSVYENLSTWQAYDAMKAEINLIERDRIIRELGDQLFYGYAGLPLLNLGASIVVDPAVVKEYVYPGSTRVIITHLEYVEAANTK